MFFDIFFKEKRFLNDVGRKCNEFLFSRLEENPDKVAVYWALKNSFEYRSQNLKNRTPERAKEIWRNISLTEMIERLKRQQKADPKSIFFWLVEVHARLMTKEEFEKFFKEILPTVSQDFLDIIIFKNPKLNLQFKT